jgi:hypothetical protein
MAQAQVHPLRWLLKVPKLSAPGSAPEADNRALPGGEPSSAANVVDLLWRSSGLLFLMVVVERQAIDAIGQAALDRPVDRSADCVLMAEDDTLR